MAESFTALYVHVPFCAAKCDYCAFYSVAGASDDLRRAYLERVERELASAVARCGPLDSVYVGGGTPSSLEAPELARLLGAIRGTGELAPGAEFTVECNPGSVSEPKTDALAEAGVNRVSLGVQSFRPHLLSAIGRRACPFDLEHVLDALRGRGIVNLGIDMIYAIPGQAMAEWREDVERACALGISHLSAYELTLHEGTPLAESGVQPVDEGLAVEMWHAAAEVAGRSGLRRYEVSNLAAPGRACRHNQDVWHGRAYVGCGPAASSFDGELRWTKAADLRRWLDGAPPERDPLPRPRRAAELLALGLRTVRGWGAEEFRARTGFDYRSLRGDELERLAAEGLILLAEDGVRPTERGLLFADMIERRLL